MKTKNYRISEQKAKAFRKKLKKDFKKWSKEKSRAFYVEGKEKITKRQLRFSKAALMQSLGNGWLNDVRNFLTRKGVWENFPLYSNEVVVFAPSLEATAEPIVVPPFGEKIFSVGFGDISFINGFSCTGNVCGSQDLCSFGIDLGCPPEACSGDCGTNTCGDQDCGDFNCGTNTCDTEKCDSHECENKKSSIDFLDDLNRFKDHVFVQELMDQLGESDLNLVAKSVQRIICVGGYEESLLEK